ncbi:MAG: DNA polymerase IV, partial [Bacteroidales bacterium]|nr:DNA polymerase IV [Bacteroidales bacterium]
MENIRKIIHVDMDAFYASIEQRDFPELKGKPVAVGRAKDRGVVAAASYEARKYGVFSAMPGVTALRKCPDLIFVPARFDVYREVSLQIRAIFKEYTDLVEPLSLDEAFLDVTVNKKDMPSASIIAMEIKERIREQTALTASAGVSYNKFLAKTASDMNKPNGFYLIRPQDAIAFLEQLPIEKFFGVGKVTAQKMKSMGINKGLDLKMKDKLFLITHFGKAGVYFYDVVRGIDNRPVEPNRERKSVGVERTFPNDLQTQFEIITHLYHIEQELITLIDKGKYQGRTLILKMKFHDFKQATHGITFSKPITEF